MDKSNSQVAVILLAGGTGSRMNADIPKQYLLLGNQPIALHSYQCFLTLRSVSEIVVVCEEQYHELFASTPNKHISFAKPGIRRQDSVYNGLQAISSNPDLICIHDAARPFIHAELVSRVINSALEHGAAAAATPIKFTIKEASSEQFVTNTPDRATFWEIQTPQAIDPKLLVEGFNYVKKHNLTVTDDVSLVEQLGHPVKLVMGDDRNLKITTQKDLTVAKETLKQQHV